VPYIQLGLKDPSKWLLKVKPAVQLDWNWQGRGNKGMKYSGNSENAG